MNQYLYTLAGLFHDIGKFAQRADISLERSTMLDQSKQSAGQICHMGKGGYYTHQHVIWSNYFLELYKEKFAAAGLLGEGENNLINLAVYHHRPTNKQQGIITLADHWSSGIDRNSERHLEANPEHGRDKFRSIPMLSVFPQLSTPLHNEGIPANFGYALQVLSRNETIFPQEAITLNVRNDYPELWKKFCEEFEAVNCTDPQAFITTVYHLLKKYLWYIPASTIDYPNCSLFEHSKITGAFAHCLAAYDNDHHSALLTDTQSKAIVSEGHYPVLMVCGDISGIQGFIYNISNKRAMKSLKGRSFYVQLLTETLCMELSEECNASVVNQIYAAGGKFFLLLPNTEKVRQHLASYEEAIQKKMFEDFGCGLNVYIGSIAFSMKEVNSRLHAITQDHPGKTLTIGELWHLLSEKTAKKKRRKHRPMLIENFETFFEPVGSGGDTDVCSVTAEEIPKGKSRVLERDPDEADSSIVSPAVYEQIELGGRLYQAQAILRRIKESESMVIALKTQWEVLDQKTNHQLSALQFIDLCLNEEPRISKDIAQKSTAWGFRFFGGLPMAKHDRKTRTLEELCLVDPVNDQKDKLGVLRMDVDNLGNLFMKGFQKEEASFSSLSTLSAQLDQFFSGYLNTIRQKEHYTHHVNIVYSGGDDVFAVGRWDLLIRFAIDIRTAFKKFVCNRNDISLSAGMVIVNPKFPIAKAAELAGEAEDIAKAYRYETKDVQATKNAITIFDIPLHWEYEIPFVVECKNDLVRWIDVEKCMSKGMLMKMFAYWNLYRKNDISWKWQAAYTLAKQSKERNASQKDCLETLKNLLFAGNYKNQHTAVRFDAFIAACRWAELELKTKTS